MPLDLAGNSLVGARTINIDSSLRTFTDYVGATDLDDYYRFSLTRSSSLNLSLTGLSADANVELLDSNGASISAIPASTNSGLLSESINATLNSGTYYIHVYPGSGSSSTNYNLNVQALNTNASDILWRNYANGRNLVWLMNGTTKTGSPELQAVADTNFAIAGTGDFNGDGKVDILWRNYANGRDLVWLMNGTTKTGSIELQAVADTNFKIAGTGDFNGDGKVDILWRNYANGRNLVWLMNGTTKTGSIELQAVTDTNFKIAGTGDFNGDGKVDILWRNYANGRNLVWLMDGTTKTGSIELQAVADTNFKIAGTGDFNGDGKVDILWRNYANGRNLVWLMDGTTKTGSIELQAVADTNFAIAGTIPRTNIIVDVAGNNNASAFDVGILNGTGTYKDTVGSLDTDDFYKFKLLGTSNITVSLGLVSGTAITEVRNSSGGLISNFNGLAAGTYYVKVHATSASASYSLTLTGNSPAADLLGSSFNLKDFATNTNTLSSIIVGQQFNVNFAVQNNGLTDVTSPFKVAFYLSKNGTIDTSDYRLKLASNSSLVGDYTVSGTVAAGATSTFTQALILPPPGDPFWNKAGTYYIGMIVDSGNAIAETIETNNSNQGLNIDSATTLVSLQDIDLKGVTSGFDLKTLSNTALTSGFAGQQFNANFIIKNGGATNTNAAFTVSFYLSKDTQISSASGDKLLGTYDITNLSSLIAGGSTGTLTKSLTLPPINDPFWNAVASADYYIGMVIDSGNTVLETTETNNASVGTGIDYAKTTISLNVIDLQGVTSGFTVTDQNLSTATVVDVTAGAAFDFNFSLKNSGNTNSGPFKVAFYVSTDNKYDPGTDRLLKASSASSGNDPFFYYNVGSLGAGVTSSFSLNQANNNQLILPGIADSFWSQGNGTYYIGMVIDADPNNVNNTDGLIAESDESNNYSRDPANSVTNLGTNYAKVNVGAVSGIDLKGVSFTTNASTVGAGSSVSVNYQITNTGATSVTSPFYLGFYLSTDQTITTDDIFVSSMQINSTADYSGTKTLQLDSNISPGAYYIGMFIDSGNAENAGDIAEINDTNKTGDVWTVGNNSSVGNGIDFKSITIT